MSLLSLLTTGSQESRPFLYREFPGYGGQQSIRMGEWKAVRQQMAKGILRTELYHMGTDPAERHNVAAEHWERVQMMEREMEASRRPSERFPLRPLDKPLATKNAATAYPVRRLEESMFWRQDAKCTNASSFRQKTRCFACDPPIKTSFARCFNRCSDSSSRQEKNIVYPWQACFFFSE